MADYDKPDETLVEGDFIQLLMQHEPVLRAFARSLLPSWGSVDEVIQEASITMWQKFDQLRDREGFLPWSKVVVRFKCLSAISKMARDRHVFSPGVLEQLADEAEALDGDEQMAARSALRACLAEFSQAHQELLLAPYAGDGRVRTLAEQGGKSANALYKLLGRLREKLSTCIRQNLKLQTS